MGLFFHETIDPLSQPGAHTRFLAQLGEVVTTIGNAEGSAGGQCIAAWVPVFLTGRWPKIITFWEMPGGWDGFGDHFDGYPALFHGPLERWYGERSGGFDRTLTGAPYAVSHAEVSEGAGWAPVVLQEFVTLPRGAAGDYIDALGEARASVEASDGVRLIGAYETALRDGGEVLVLWAYDSFRRFTDFQRDPATLPGLTRWRQDATNRESAYEGLLLRPTEWSPLR